ncbi:hypothetical protein C0J52_24588 [Blattella germanica]|nr:hypothetical protein C0J52_24588 [Blattella germanica]
MKVIFTVGLAVLLASFESGYGKAAPGNKLLCPAGPVPDGCPFPDKALSTFFPHANDCHWFFHCSNGVPYCKVCPANLHWNQALETCDYPERAGCTANGAETTKIPDPQTTAAPETPKPTTARPETPKPTTEKPAPPESTPVPSNDCPAGTVPSCPVPDPDFSVFFPHENDCQWFYHCSNGVAYCKVCPDGLHWNPVLDTCDWPENAGCGSGSQPNTPEKPNPTTTVKPNSTASSAPETPKPTTEKPEKPASTTPTPSDICPAGTAPSCPFPDPEFSVFFPHENDCHWFYHCSNGVAYCKICPPGLHWNPSLDTCDWPENAGCTGGFPSEATEKTEATTKVPETRPTTASPPPPPTTTTTRVPETPSTITEKPDQPTTPEPSNVCPTGAIPTCPVPDPDFSVFFPHENDCQWFFHCSNGVAYCKICPDGLHWNPVLDTCDWPENAGCGSGSQPNTPEKPDPTTTVKPNSTATPVPGTPKPTTEKPASTPAQSVCPAGAEPTCPVPDPDVSVFFPHEKDCNWFYHCSNGVAHCKVCPDGLHWNPNLNTCDWPENAGCGNGNVPTTTKRPEAPTTAKPTPAATTTTKKPETPVPTTDLPTPTADPSGDCPVGKVPTCPFPDPEFSVFFPHENDCHWFYHCSNGVAYCKVCPADLHWNPDKDTCDYSYRAGCTA